VAAPSQAPPPPPPVKERTPWLSTWSPLQRMALRWTFIGAVTLFAFHRSFLDLVVSTRQESLNGYVWMVWLACLVAALGITYRRRNELPIHDRQTDIIVAVMGLVLAMLVHGVLLERYALYFQLLRLDLVAAWLFVLSASVAVFGLRPTTRFIPVWLILLAVFPMPYHLLVVILGGSNVAAGMGTLVISAAATTVAVGRGRVRSALAGVAAWSVGLLVLAIMRFAFPNASLFAYQMIPAAAALLSVALTMYVVVRRRPGRDLFERVIEPLGAAQVWSALPLVLVVGIVLSFVRLPDSAVTPVARVDGVHFERAGLPVPAGWHLAGIQSYPWISRFYGPDTQFVRQQIVANVGDARFDRQARPRTVMIDTTTTSRHYGFTIFPPRMLYRVASVRLSRPRTTDLGFGVTGALFSVVDDQLLVSWNALEWTWISGKVQQRVMVISVDNHDDDAPFPLPTGGIAPTLNALFTVLFRGNAVAEDVSARVKDAALLVEVGRAVVSTQLQPAGVRP
jgi:hypothetical protein